MVLVNTLFILRSEVPKEKQQEEWTWKDREGQTRSRDDLDNILEQHKLWLDSDRKSGTRAQLSNADLRGANLKGAFYEPKKNPPPLAASAETMRF